VGGQIVRLFLAFLVVIALSCAGTTGGSTAVTQPKLPRASFVFLTHTYSENLCHKDQCIPASRVKFVGSGFSIATDKTGSLIMTAGHLCKRPVPKYTGGFRMSTESSMTAATPGGGKYPAKVLAVYTGIDACVLRIDGVHITPVKFATEAPKYGERVYALAAPLGLYSSEMLPKFEGFYSGSAYKVAKPSPWTGSFDELTIYTIPTRGGSSGAPVFNSKGEVIGIIIMAAISLENLCWSPTFEALQQIWLALEREAYGKKKEEGKNSWERGASAPNNENFTPEYVKCFLTKEEAK